MMAQNERAATGTSGDGPLEVARLSKTSNQDDSSNEGGNNFNRGCG